MMAASLRELKSYPTALYLLEKINREYVIENK